MRKKAFHILYTIFKFANILAAIMLVISILVPYAHPQYLWIVAIIGLAFPVLWFVNVLFCIVWLFNRRRNAFISLAALLLSLPVIFKIYAVNKTQEFSSQPSPGALRVLSWNVGLLNFIQNDHDYAAVQNKIIFDSIRKADPDVICLQEFFSAVIPGTNFHFIDSIANSMGYKYHYFSRDNPYFAKTYYSGSIIYSRYPMIDSGRIDFAGDKTGGILSCRIVKGTDTMQIITSRFQSFYFHGQDYNTINNMKRGYPDFSGAIGILRKLKYAYRDRAQQIHLLDSVIKNANEPVILACDLNDVPLSYAHKQIRKSMYDVWLKKGNGLGRTFRHLSPILRIDHIFFNKYFDPLQVKIIKTTASDHYALVADFRLKK